MNNLLKILLIEDNPGDARLIEEMLKESGIEFKLECVTSLSSGIDEVRLDGFSVILLDLGLPDSQGLGTLTKLKEIKPQAPIIVLTGLADEEIGTKAVQGGAQDYLIKGQLDHRLLSKSIRYAVERMRMDKERDRLNNELEQILYAASHDLKTPLVNINGYTGEVEQSIEMILSLIEREDISSEAREKIASVARELPEAFKFISMSVSRMDILLNGLLQFSRSGRVDLKIESIDMNMLIKGIVSDLNFRLKEAGANFEAADLPQCAGDRQLISRIFTNLIENAVKYLDPARKGKITVTGWIKDSLSVYCVEDNGIGIAEVHQKQIFHIFHQLDPMKAGEGLGLAIVQRIAERHGGKVWLESEAGKGSRFYVALPQKP